MATGNDQDAPARLVKREPKVLSMDGTRAVRLTICAAIATAAVVMGTSAPAGARMAVTDWAVLPRVDEYAADWARMADEMFPDDYTRVWDQTVEEMCGLLLSCRQWLDRGSLARDQDVLHDLGAYGNEGGSGTRTAAAAIYFAARYAARPPAGLLAAAFARRTDADTIACATGSLLGAIAGLDWIREISRGLRDSPYIATVGTSLAIHDPTILAPSSWEPNVRRKALAAVARTDVGDTLWLPVFGRSEVVDVEWPQTKSANSIGIYWLHSEIGQTLAMTKVSKAAATKPRRHQEQTLISDEPAPQHDDVSTHTAETTDHDPANDGVFTLLLRVSDLRRTVALYHDVLKLPLGRQTDQLAVFGRNLAFLRDVRVGHARDSQAAWRSSANPPSGGAAISCPACTACERRQSATESWFPGRPSRPAELLARVGPSA